MSRKYVKIVVGVVVALGAILFIAQQGMTDVSLYKHVEEVHAEKARWVGTKNLQVHGFVVPGSIHESIVDQKARRTFTLQGVKAENRHLTIQVRHAGVKPDTFKEQAETVVKGQLVEEDAQLVLLAVEGEAGIMAKCPSKYDGKR